MHYLEILLYKVVAFFFVWFLIEVELFCYCQEAVQNITLIALLIQLCV